MRANPLVLEIQTMLKKAGFYHGELDGAWGPMSRQALKVALLMATDGVAENPDIKEETISEEVENDVEDTSKENLKSKKFKLGKKSLKKIEPLHSDLKRVVKRAIELTEVDFTVGETLRSRARQRELFRKGATKTMNSRHLTGHAVDLFAIDENGNISWDWKYYYPIAKAMKAAANQYGVDLEWGGDWRTFKDGPHFQLSWRKYKA